MCKGFKTFEARAVFWRFLVSLSFANCTLNLVVLVFLCSGIPSDFSDPSTGTLHIYPKSYLNPFSRLGDPWMDRLS
jgi:hypothetical protein